MQKVKRVDWGEISYKEAWDRQAQLQQELIQVKRNALDKKNYANLHKFVFCEHPPVFTLGKSGKDHHLLLNQSDLEAKGIAFYKVNRGGDITYHGPGQIVGYPLFDLDLFFTDVHKYVRTLEEGIIQTLKEFSVEALRKEGYTGVWCPPNEKNPQWRKICAIGVHLSRWVSMHGFALNVNTLLNPFEFIIPCGIQEEDKTITSLQKELQQTVDTQQVKDLLLKKYSELFPFEPI
jgi:lipoyl(octanoyl) transferase